MDFISSCNSMVGKLNERLIPVDVDGDNNDDLRTRIWIESRALCRIAFPSILSRMSSFGMLVVTQLFLGHVSDLNIAAYAIVQIIFLRFVNGILLGMSSATETLCGQAFGAGQFHMLGIYLQRSWIVDGISATILLPVFIFATPILKFIGQDADVSELSGTIALWFIPVIYYYVFSLTIQMYLQAQQKNMIIGWLSVFSFVLHLFLSWLLVIKLGFGIHGAMASLVVSFWSVVIGELVYIFCGWCPNTWKGFSVATFNDMWPMVKLSVSSGVMLCLELWYNSVLVLVAGYMQNASTAISAFSICLNINSWELMICLGFLASSCVRVSNELGRGNPKAVKFSIKVALIIDASIGFFFFILCLVFGHHISYLFTDNEEVAKTVSGLSVLLSFSVLLNGCQTVLIGVLIGAGLQGVAAIVNLGSYYVIGVPFGVLLAYVAHLQVYGLWIGLLSGVVVQTIIFSYIIWKTDWEHQVQNASQRLNVWLREPEETSSDTFIA